ncbi:CrcB family protein [Arcanobacterium sp. S3PF19]|uniref:fluoride efflux transporter FluC n=1 Tax=Arcanobacterium sp. S3PF19 TaxID=1219585 RepID=UPI000690D5A7|nr:CrcB family protein [Arcanobacterium sp. S3PF19]
MRFTDLFLLAAFGGLGGTFRYLIDSHMPKDRFPRGTFTVNLLGSLLLGVFFALCLHGYPARIFLLCGTGFCGALTTFGTASHETVSLWQKGKEKTALFFACGMFCVCFFAMVCAVAAVKMLLGS